MRYIHGERVFWGREILKSDLFLAYLSCTVTTMLLVYNKDLALNTFCLLTFRFWVLWKVQFCRNLIVYQWDKMFYASTSAVPEFRAEASMIPYFKSLSFYLQLHIPWTFPCDLRWESLKITTENTQSQQHRTGGPSFESNVQNSTQGGKLQFTFHGGGVKIRS